jgi:hypothetical protein
MQIAKTDYLRQKLYFFYNAGRDKNMPNNIDFKKPILLSEQVIDELISYYKSFPNFTQVLMILEAKNYISTLGSEDKRLEWLIRLIRHGKNKMRGMLCYIKSGSFFDNYIPDPNRPKDRLYKGFKYSSPADLNLSIPCPDDTFRKI